MVVDIAEWWSQPTTADLRGQNTEASMGTMLQYTIDVCLTLLLQAEGSAGPCATLLSHRSLVRVNGSDTRNFLQGILTADITSDVVAQYCMMLNPQVGISYFSL